MPYLPHYGVRCKVTGCTVEPLLEVVHIFNHRLQEGDNGYDDGILVRVDIHRAYDRGLIRFDGVYRVVYLDDRLATRARCGMMGCG